MGGVLRSLKIEKNKIASLLLGLNTRLCAVISKTLHFSLPNSLRDTNEVFCALGNLAGVYFFLLLGREARTYQSVATIGGWVVLLRWRAALRACPNNPSGGDQKKKKTLLSTSSSPSVVDPHFRISGLVDPPAAPDQLFLLWGRSPGKGAETHTVEGKGISGGGGE